MGEDINTKDSKKYADVPLRVRSWLVIIPVFFAGVYNVYTISLFAAFLILWTQKELSEIYRVFSKKASVLILVLVIFQSICFMNQFFIWSFILSGIMLTIHAFLALFLTLPKRVNTYIVTIFVTLFSLPFLVMIRVYNYDLNFWSGYFLLILLVIPTELNDVFQYLSGKLFGKHKIVPKISPSKTTEGFVGGLILTTCLTTVLASCIFGGFSFLFIPLGLLIGGFGFLGDIFLSFNKRKVNVKDTGSLIPGHGGLLDRIDSLIFITPLFYILVCL